ncbi:MAG: hypothetical protein DHS80DRAFT_21249 [Piptocephalis tieghemiana]|nr:MAG: hypothetical protein DHS80DRAFT_21249 [Piptocephalis tieghemiana]
MSIIHSSHHPSSSHALLLFVILLFLILPYHGNSSPLKELGVEPKVIPDEPLPDDYPRKKSIFGGKSRLSPKVINVGSANGGNDIEGLPAGLLKGQEGAGVNQGPDSAKVNQLKLKAFNKWKVKTHITLKKDQRKRINLDKNTEAEQWQQGKRKKTLRKGARPVARNSEEPPTPPWRKPAWKAGINLRVLFAPYWSSSTTNALQKEYLEGLSEIYDWGIDQAIGFLEDIFHIDLFLPVSPKNHIGGNITDAALERIKQYQLGGPPGERSFFEKAMLKPNFTIKSPYVSFVGQALNKGIKKAHDLTMELLKSASKEFKNDLILGLVGVVLAHVRDGTEFEFGGESHHRIHTASTKVLARLLMTFYKKLMEHIYQGTNMLVRTIIVFLLPSNGKRKYPRWTPLLLIIRSKIVYVRGLIRSSIRDAMVMMMKLCFPFNVTSKSSMESREYQDFLTQYVRKALREADKDTFDALDVA